MVELNIDPRFTRSIFTANQKRVSDEVISIAAIMSVSN